MGEFSISHWLILLAILLIFFGPSKLPQLGKSMGEAIRGFKKGLNEGDTPNNNAAQSSRPEAIQAADQKKEQELSKNKTEV